MEIMYFFNFINLEDILKAMQHIKLFRCGFHQNRHAIAEYWYCCKDTDDRKDDCAYGISYLGFWVKIDDQSCYHYTYTLDDITNDMDNRSSDVHVFMAVSMMTMSMAMTVAMSMPMAMIMLIFIMIMFLIVLLIMLNFIIMIVMMVMVMVSFLLVIMTMAMTVTMMVGIPGISRDN